jgi:hypothetical protein
MKNVTLMLLFVVLLSSCATQKTVQIANGKFVTEKQYQRGIDKAFRKAERAGRKGVKNSISKEEVKSFEKSLNESLDINFDTTRVRN